MLTGSTVLVKKINRMLIIRAIQKNGPVSRSQLATITGLSHSTVSGIVSELITTNIVKETGVGKSIGGRRPIMLNINKNGGYIIGVDIGSSRIHCGIVDLHAHICLKRATPTPKQSDKAVAAIIELIQETIQEATQQGMDRIMRIGIAMPGFINNDKTIVIKASNLGWEHVELPTLVSNAVGIETVMDNNTNAAALAEYYYGLGNEVENLLYIAAGNGIGAGIVIQGSVLTGVNHLAGEIGHMKMISDGELCMCGRYGCLETVASGMAIQRMAIQRSTQSPRLQHELAATGQLSAKQVFAMSQESEPISKQIIDTAMNYLGTAAGNIANILNPEIIVFGGGLSKAGTAFIERVRSEANKIILQQNRQNIPLVLSKLGDNAGIMGAATLGLQQLLRPVPL